MMHFTNNIVLLIAHTRVKNISHYPQPHLIARPLKGITKIYRELPSLRLRGAHKKHHDDITFATATQQNLTLRYFIRIIFTLFFKDIYSQVDYFYDV